MDKWTAIFLIGLTAFMMGPVAVGAYNESNCKTEAIRHGMGADDILKLCK